MDLADEGRVRPIVGGILIPPNKIKLRIERSRRVKEQGAYIPTDAVLPSSAAA